MRNIKSCQIMRLNVKFTVKFSLFLKFSIFIIFFYSNSVKSHLEILDWSVIYNALVGQNFLNFLLNCWQDLGTGSVFFFKVQVPSFSSRSSFFQRTSSNVLNLYVTLVHTFFSNTYKNGHYICAVKVKDIFWALDDNSPPKKVDTCYVQKNVRLLAFKP